MWKSIVVEMECMQWEAQNDNQGRSQWKIGQFLPYSRLIILPFFLIQHTLTWTTGSSCVPDHSYVCVRIHMGIGHTDSEPAQHFWFGKTQVSRFSCALDGVRTSGHRILSLTLPIEPPFHNLFIVIHTAFSQCVQTLLILVSSSIVIDTWIMSHTHRAINLWFWHVFKWGNWWIFCLGFLMWMSVVFPGS